MTTQLLQQALDALETDPPLTEIAKEALRSAIAAPQAKPVAWKCARCGNTSDCEGVTAGDNWCNSCAVCGEMRPLYATPPAPQASPVPDGMVMVPREIIDRFPEINPSNYDHDDACALNAWGVEVVLAASPAAPVVRKLARMPAHEWEGDYPSADSYKEGYAEGWNDCLDAIDGITGGSK